MACRIADPLAAGLQVGEGSELAGWPPAKHACAAMSSAFIGAVLGLVLAFGGARVKAALIGQSAGSSGYLLREPWWAPSWLPEVTCVQKRTDPERKRNARAHRKRNARWRAMISYLVALVILRRGRSPERLDEELNRYGSGFLEHECCA